MLRFSISISSWRSKEEPCASIVMQQKGVDRVKGETRHRQLQSDTATWESDHSQSCVQFKSSANNSFFIISGQDEKNSNSKLGELIAGGSGDNSSDCTSHSSQGSQGSQCSTHSRQRCSSVWNNVKPLCAASTFAYKVTVITDCALSGNFFLFRLS